jgi:hypothetical protein
MALIIRPLNENDYDTTLIEWWRNWGWEPVEKEFLPDNGKGGLMVLDDEEPVCAGFVYTTNSKVAWVDWIVSSDTYRKKPERSEAIKLLVETLTNICRNTDHKYVYALIKNNSLVETYEDLGYVKGSIYTTEMIKVL